MSEFLRIGLVAKQESVRALATLQRVIRYLQNRGVEIVLEQHTAAELGDTKLVIADYDSIGKGCDLVIVIGGDGTLLGAGRALAKYKVPVLGIHRGRLGFLTDITPDNIEAKLDEVFNGKYTEAKRFLLETSVKRQGALIGDGDALNDVVIHPGRFVRMIEFELYIDDQFVYSQRSDGLIISTPTGSTAYALSGGGPIMHPKLDAIVIVPMNPHTLSSRPIVVDGNSKLKILIGGQNSTFPHVTCDGQHHVVTNPGDEILVQKKSQNLHLIHPLNHDFYESCRSKLGWGSHLGNSDY
jgi:NAD+ kinase